MELEKILNSDYTFVYVENEEQIKQYTEKMAEYGYKCDLERLIGIFNDNEVYDCLGVSISYKECLIYKSETWIGSEDYKIYTFNELFNKHPIFKSEKEILEYCYRERAIIRLDNNIEISMFIELYNRNSKHSYPYDKHDKLTHKIYIRLFPYKYCDDLGCIVYGFNPNFEYYEREEGVTKQIGFEELYGWLE